MNRRIFLRGAGGFVLAAPLLGTLKEARGESTPPPRRLVVFFQHCGVITDQWWPALQDGPLRADTFTGTSLELLNPFYEKLLLPRGFRSMNQYAVGQSIDPHDQAMGSKLTCAPISSSSQRYALAESLDHTIARQLNAGGAKPLVLGVGRASSSIKDVVSFSAPEAAYPANVNPSSVYDALVRGVGSAGPTSTQPDTRARLRQSVIDIVRDDLDTLRRFDMSQADQHKLDAWLDLLRDTEIGIGDLPAACSLDTAERLGITADSVLAASPSTGDVDAAEELAKSFTLGSDMMMNLMALSMICDANRSLVLHFPGYVVFNWDGIVQDRDHAAIAYRTGDYTVGGSCMPGNAVAELLKIDRWYAKKYARLVGLLDGIDEGDGTLLDHSAVMWLNEFSDGAACNLNNLPILIAGGAGGYLKQGFAVNVEGKTLEQGQSSSSCNGNGGTVGPTGSQGGDVPINKLYVTLMNALGCTQDGTPEGDQVTRFGVFDGLTPDSGITDPGEAAALRALS